MENENSKQLLLILKQALEKNNVVEDISKIQHLIRELENIENKIFSCKKLEELKKIITDLEVKYDDFNELSYYFNPLYANINNKIHNEEVKKIREENKRKRDVN